VASQKRLQALEAVVGAAGPSLTHSTEICMRCAPKEVFWRVLKVVFKSVKTLCPQGPLLHHRAWLWAAWQAQLPAKRLRGRHASGPARKGRHLETPILAVFYKTPMLFTL
jgi:hypothetical protein